MLATQTFGDYARWHPHIHAIVADGLFRPSGVFHVMPRTDLRPLAELFRARVLARLKKEGLMTTPSLSASCSGGMSLGLAWTTLRVQARRIPPPVWRECIKKIWEVDPLQCPRCKGEMQIISCIDRGAGDSGDTGALASVA